MKALVSKIWDDDLPTKAAALAYFSALSIAPLTVVTLVIISYVPRSAEDVSNQVLFLFGPTASELTRHLLQNITPARSWAGGVSVLLSLFFASAMFAQLQTSLNQIFQVRSRPFRVWFLKRLLSIGLVFIFILLLFLSSFAIQVLSAWNVGAFSSPLHELLRLLLLMASPVFLLKFLPERSVSWLGAIVGGISVGMMFEVGNQILALYLKESAITSLYGAMGSLMAFLLWIFYSALILLFGAEITFQFLKR